MSDAFDRLSAVIDENRKNIDTTTKEERDKAVWKAAVDCWNEDVAGTVTTIDGTVIDIPKFDAL